MRLGRLAALGFAAALLTCSYPSSAQAGGASTYVAGGLGFSAGYIKANRSAYTESGYAYGPPGCCAAASGTASGFSELLLVTVRQPSLSTFDVAAGVEGWLNPRLDVTYAVALPGSTHRQAVTLGLGVGYGAMSTEGREDGSCCETARTTRSGPTASLVLRYDSTSGERRSYFFRLEVRARVMMASSQHWVGEGSATYDFQRPGLSYDFGLSVFVGGGGGGARPEPGQ